MRLSVFSEICFLNFPKKNNILFFEYLPKNISKILIGKLDSNYIFGNVTREFNLFVLISIIFNFKSIFVMLRENFYTAYAYQFIKFSKPKIIITTGDNNINFYRLKKYFINIKFISIQNGARSIINDIFGDDNLDKFRKKKNEENHADIIFTFNNSISQKYKNNFNSKTVTIGKFLNNTFCVANNFTSKKIAYISQFRASIYKKEFFIWNNKKICDVRQWYEVERLLMPILKKFCIRNRYELTVIGAAKTKEDKILEKKFYNLYLENSNWRYWNNSSDIKKRYLFYNKFSTFVCSWTTLGYELISRNCKVAFFRARNIPPYNDRDFGWPYKMPKKGFWYTNHVSEREVYRVLHNLISIKKSEWINKISYYKRNVMFYDKNNSILKKYLKNFLKAENKN